MNPENREVDSRFDQLATLLAAGGPPVLTRDWYRLLGFGSPHLMTKALRRDPRFVSRKSGVVKWELAR